MAIAVESINGIFECDDEDDAFVCRYLNGGGAAKWARNMVHEVIGIYYPGFFSMAHLLGWTRCPVRLRNQTLGDRRDPVEPRTLAMWLTTFEDVVYVAYALEDPYVEVCVRWCTLWREEWWCKALRSTTCARGREALCYVLGMDARLRRNVLRAKGVRVRRSAGFYQTWAPPPIAMKGVTYDDLPDHPTVRHLRHPDLCLDHERICTHGQAHSDPGLEPGEHQSRAPLSPP